MAVYVSRHPHLKLVGAPTPDRVVDFGKDNPPGQFETTNPTLIAWLENHPQFGVLFFKDELPTPVDPGDIFVPTDIDQLHEKLSASFFTLASKERKRVVTSGNFFLGASKLNESFTAVVRGFDPVDQRLFVHDQTNNQLKQSSNFGDTISINKGTPTGVQASSIARVLRFGEYLYAAAASNIYRTPPKPGNDPFEWSESLHTLKASPFPTGFDADNKYIYVAEYGDPEGGPSVYRSADGETWELIYGPDDDLRHIHAIAPDPYNPGHVWMTTGDGTTKSIMLSTDYGENWEVVVASSAFQGVQISFDPNWVYIAGDNQRGTLIVLDRETHTPRWGTPNWHANIAVPGGAAEDSFYRNAYWGAVDPDTGIYYCVANDTSVPGNRNGLFYTPRVGEPLQLLDPLPSPVSAGHTVYIAGKYVFFGQYRKERLSADWI